MNVVLFCMTQLSFFSFLNSQTIEEGEDRLKKIHSKLHLIHGSFSEEYPEQLMTAMYLKKNAKVLEFGANVGRNSCVIASILSDSKNLVALECCEESAKLLKENRDANNLNFNIEAAAISIVPLLQSEWNTIVSEIDIPRYTRVNIISFKEVEKKYNIKFDTLVVDCEGALYNVLQNEPNLLKNIKMVIIENDFEFIDQMLFVQRQFKKNGLKLIYNQALGKEWGPRACREYFYQVWKKPKKQY